MLKANKLGGIDDLSEDALKRAKRVDLITMPKSIKGTNCGNCKFIKPDTEHYGYCSHPSVKLPVNNRMCCILWSAAGEYRSF